MSKLLKKFQSSLMLLFPLSMAMAGSQASADLRVTVIGGASPGDLARISTFVAETVQALPRGFREALPAGLSVQFGGKVFARTDSDSVVPQCRPSGSRSAALAPSTPVGHLGRDRRTIELHPGFVPYITGQRSDIRFDCYHGSVLAQARASLIHELAHVYDQAAKASGQEIFRNLYADSFGKRRALQVIVPPRSPDAYEYQSAEEAFAVNAEYFALDREYERRRPLHHAFFSRIFGQGARASSYPSEVELFMTTLELRKVSADRLVGVEYVLSLDGAEGEGTGHSAIRLVICAPDAPRDLGSCRKDWRHHLVVSPVGDTQFEGKWTIDKGDGLNGRYPILYEVHTFAGYLAERRSLFKKVFSLPLHTQPERLKAFLLHVAQLNWNPSGNYFFVSRNCASLTKSLLSVLYPELLKADPMLVTPKWLFTHVARAGYVRSAPRSALKTESRAFDESYLFAPMPAGLQSAAENLMAAPGFADGIRFVPSVAKLGRRMDPLSVAHALVLKSSPDERAGLYARILEKASNRTTIAFSLLRIEGFIVDEFSMALINRHVREVEKAGNSALGESTRRLAALLKEARKAAGGESGYGIPQPSDFGRDRERLDDVLRELLAVRKQALSILAQADDPVFAKLARNLRQILEGAQASSR